MAKYYLSVVAFLVGFLGLTFTSIADLHAQDSGMSASSGTEIGNSKTVGLGVGYGTFVRGISGKFYLSDSSAFQGLFGIHPWGTAGEGHFLLESKLNEEDFGQFDIFYGGGAAYLSASSFGYSWSSWGLQGLVGVSLKFKEAPVEVTAEFKPGMYFTTSDVGYSGAGGLDLFAGGASARFYF